MTKQEKFLKEYEKLCKKHMMYINHYDPVFALSIAEAQTEEEIELHLMEINKYN